MKLKIDISDNNIKMDVTACANEKPDSAKDIRIAEASVNIALKDKNAPNLQKDSSEPSYHNIHNIVFDEYFEQVQAKYICFMLKHCKLFFVFIVLYLIGGILIAFWGAKKFPTDDTYYYIGLIIVTVTCLVLAFYQANKFKNNYMDEYSEIYTSDILRLKTILKRNHIYNKYAIEMMITRYEEIVDSYNRTSDLQKNMAGGLAVASVALIIKYIETTMQYIYNSVIADIKENYIVSAETIYLSQIKYEAYKGENQIYIILIILAAIGIGYLLFISISSRARPKYIRIISDLREILVGL